MSVLTVLEIARPNWIRKFLISMRLRTTLPAVGLLSLDMPFTPCLPSREQVPIIKGFYQSVESHSTTRPFVHKAAAFLHSPLVLLVDFGQDDAGAVKDGSCARVIAGAELYCHRIGAQLQAVCARFAIWQGY